MGDTALGGEIVAGTVWAGCSPAALALAEAGPAAGRPAGENRRSRTRQLDTKVVPLGHLVAQCLRLLRRVVPGSLGRSAGRRLQ